MKSRADLQRIHLIQLLESMLTWNERQQLEQLFPTHIVVPSGSRIPIDYTDVNAPSIAVRLQEVFGLKDDTLYCWGENSNHLASAISSTASCADHEGFGKLLEERLL